MNWLSTLGWTKEHCKDLRYLGFAYIQQGHYDTALSIFNALAVLQEPTAYDLRTLGALYLEKNDALKALDFLDRSLKLEPAHLATQLNRTKALFMLGYKKQGILMATELAKNTHRATANQAAALLMAFS